MSLKIYVLPAINGSVSFHARFLKPANKIEYSALFASFVVRKWRYQLSDMFGAHWHDFGNWAHANNHFPMKKLYEAGNRITSRRANDEYLLKMIPERTQNVIIHNTDRVHLSYDA